MPGEGESGAWRENVIMALIHVNVYSAAMHANNGVQVILPTPQVRRAGKEGFTGYDTPRRFPVLYLLHGTYGDETDYLRFSRIESYAQQYDLAVVMPDAGNSCYRNVPRTGAEYWNFVTDELLKMMRWMFPISDKPEETFLCGLSMGANGAFKIGMSNPGNYGAIACMSAKCSGWQEAADRDDTVWSSAFLPGENLTGSEEDLYFLAKQAAAAGGVLPTLYLCVGQQDGFYQENKEFVSYLNALGISHVFHEQPGGHDWDFWDDELRRILAWLPVERRDPKKRWF